MGLTDYETASIPPATAPVITGGTDPHDAATNAMPDGDSDQPGQAPAEEPMRHPDQDRPGEGGGGYEPGGAPAETPPSVTPPEIMPPPD